MIGPVFLNMNFPEIYARLDTSSYLDDKIYFPSLNPDSNISSSSGGNTTETLPPEVQSGCLAADIYRYSTLLYITLHYSAHIYSTLHQSRYLYPTLPADISGNCFLLCHQLPLPTIAIPSRHHRKRGGEKEENSHTLPSLKLSLHISQTESVINFRKAAKLGLIFKLKFQSL